MVINLRKDFILVDRDAQSTESEGGILLPDVSQTKKVTGHVKAMGPDVEGIRIGDRILFKRYAGSDVEVDGQKYTIIEADHVVATLGSPKPDGWPVDNPFLGSGATPSATPPGLS